MAPGLARDLVRVLRAERDRDPGLGELRGRLRDRITDAYLRRELGGGGRLDPAELAAEVGTRRRWPASGWPPCAPNTPAAKAWRSSANPSATAARAQLAGLQAHFAAGGHQQLAVADALPIPSGWPPRWNATTGPARSAAGERLARPARPRAGWRPAQYRPAAGRARAGPSTAGERIAQLWHAQQQDPAGRPLAPAGSPGGWASPTLRPARHLAAPHPVGAATTAERLAATDQQLASPPPPVQRADGERDWRAWTPPAPRSTPSCSSPNPARSPRPPRPSRCAPAARSAALPGGGLARPQARRTTPASSPAPPPATAWPQPRIVRGGHPVPAGPHRGRERRWHWRTRASTGPPASWACPSRRCAARLTSTACPSRRRSRAAPAHPFLPGPRRRRAGLAARRKGGHQPDPQGTRRLGPGALRTACSATASACHHAPPPSRPHPGWTRRLSRSTVAYSGPGTFGRGAGRLGAPRRSTPPWAPRWWSS